MEDSNKETIIPATGGSDEPFLGPIDIILLVLLAAGAAWWIFIKNKKKEAPISPIKSYSIQ